MLQALFLSFVYFISLTLHGQSGFKNSNTIPHLPALNI